MSIRVDTSSFAGSGITVGGTGLGVTGAVIRATTGSGEHGPGVLYDDWDSAADDSKEFRALVLTPPSAGQFFMHEDGSFTLTGAPDGSYTLQYRLDIDGVSQGTATETIQVGVVAVTSDLVLSYAVRAVVSADLPLSYSVRTSALADLALAYAVRAAVIADLPLAYSVAAQPGTVISDLVLSYAVRGAVTADLPLAWQIASPVSPVAADLVLAWTVRAAVVRDLPLNYFVDGEPTLPTTPPDRRQSVSGEIRRQAVAGELRRRSVTLQ